MTDPRDQRIAELEAENAAYKARIADLERKVEQLTQRGLTPQEKLNRNSGNSNKPPSSDSPDQKSERRGKGGTGGKRGGQPGHSGSTRALVPPEQASELKPLFPLECENAGRLFRGHRARRGQRLPVVEQNPEVVEQLAPESPGRTIALGE